MHLNLFTNKSGEWSLWRVLRMYWSNFSWKLIWSSQSVISSFNLLALLDLLFLDISSLKSPPITISCEFWYFCIIYTGDEDFIFTKCHRGYGGVAIPWSKCIDPLVKVFKEGNSRIQCIELKTNIPILMMMVKKRSNSFNIFTVKR
jgi:hypothetical protein